MTEGSSVFNVIFWIIIFFAVFALGLSVVVSNGIVAIFAQVPSLTGIEGFAFYNLMLWIVLAFFVWVLWITR